MNLKKTDVERIIYRNCEEKDCLNKAYAIFKTKFLCEDHFRKKVPEKSTTYMKAWRNALNPKLKSKWSK